MNIPNAFPRAHKPCRIGAIALSLLAITAVCAGAVAQEGEPAGPVEKRASPQPFSAHYVVSWKGINAATSTLELRPESAGRYRYVSRNNARGIFRLAFPGEGLQTTTVSVNDGAVRPEQFRGDDGTGKPDKAVSLDFDWARRRVTGTSEKRPVDLAITAGVHDILSAQVALMLDLALGRAPAPFVLVDKGQLKDYRYETGPPERLDTPLGKLETVVYATRRDGSDRSTRVWYAPSLGYAPVKAERRRGDKLEFTLLIKSIKRGAA